MANENGKIVEITKLQLKDKLIVHLLVALRLAAMLAAATAAILMGLNKQSRTIPTAVVGTTHIYQTYTAKFQQTPAFVYFVIANAIASMYNILVLLIRPFLKGMTHDVVIHLLDMVILSLLATGAAAATSIAELGKNGNLHARWNPICNKFNAFCSHGGMALVACFVGAVFQLISNGLSTFTLRRKDANHT